MKLKEKLEKKEFVFTIEFDPPLNLDMDSLLENIGKYLNHTSLFYANTIKHYPISILYYDYFKGLYN